jgi:predicted esterase
MTATAKNARCKCCLITAAWLLSLANVAPAADTSPLPMQPGTEGVVTLPGELPNNLPREPLFDHELKLDQEKFYLFVPSNYRNKQSFGLIAFIHAGNEMSVPNDWKKVLTRHRLLYIAPQDIGNEHPVPRRALATLVAIRKMIELYQVDPQRVYITGHSGGAKVAGRVAFAQPDLIRGALPMCGFLIPEAGQYDKAHLEKVKSQVGFALITGSKDFNHKAILAYYNDTLTPEKYRAKLFDVPGMKHQVARGDTLSSALKWLESQKPEKKPAATESSERRRG